MTDSDESIDSVELEHSMLVDEYKELIKELQELQLQNADKPKKQEMKIENFEAQWQQLHKTKKQLEEKIAEMHYQQNIKQEELEDYQDKLLLVKEQILRCNKELQEKETLVKVLSKQLKDM